MLLEILILGILLLVCEFLIPLYTSLLSFLLIFALCNRRYYAGWADKITGQTIEVGKQKVVYTVQEPYGVCGQIIPWNYPILMWAWKVGPALAAGCK